MAIRLNTTLKKVESKISSTITSFKKDLTHKSWSSTFSLIKESALKIGLAYEEKLLKHQLSQYMSLVESKLVNLDRSISSHLATLDKMFGTNVLKTLLGPEQSGSSVECNYSKFLLQDPYITGYFYVAFTLPDNLARNLNMNIGNTIGYLCKEVNEPTLNVNSAERHGFGQVVQNVPVNVTYEEQTTMTFYDTYNLAINQFFKAWIYTIHDTRTGLPLYKAQSDFKGSCIIIHFNPAFKKIMVNAFIGIYPTSLPLTNQSRDNIGIKETQVTFTFDQFLPVNSKT